MSKHKHAIVIGGSLAGLLAARVLSEHFEKVTVLERDHYPNAVEPRRGVPQGHHGHGLLASGFRALEDLFPGFKEALVQAGALPVDVIGDLRWYQFGGYKAQFNSGLGGVLMSRPLIEAVVRRQTLSLPEVEVIEGCSVKNLLSDVAKGRVTGVKLIKEGNETILKADFFVDASGRGSRSPAWLEGLGYPKPQEERIGVDIGYTSRVYPRKPDDLKGDLGALINPTPPFEKRAGFLLALEEDRWLVSLSGWLGDHAPTDLEGYLAYARSLPRPEIYDLIKELKPLTDGVVHKLPSNLRRRYEKLRRFPAGYLVMGDAMCSFNPVYGQGMTVAALEAVALQNCLNQTKLDGLACRFFKRAARLIDTPWTIAAGEDFRYPEVQGKRPLGTKFLHRYMRKVHLAARHDETVCQAFFDVANLLKPPTSLFKPSILLRVLQGGRRELTAQPSPVTASVQQTETT